ncbi:MAG: EAL domain-containing protein [Lachnospiraceae bacterium]|nr:EAL domain-containing protein [Ruminococcus sp.]MCM1274856.1 EAL domain-containing protein [Lachnospiraceae bacterium]
MTGLRTFKRTLALISALFIFLTAFPISRPASAYARSAGGAYVVGANAKFGVSETGSGLSGLAVDYLDQISKYTLDRFTYKSGTPEELFEMLREGEIDVIPCVSAEELGLYGDDSLAAAGFSMITKFNAVYVYNNGKYKDVSFGDASAISRMKIGYLPEDEGDFFRDGRFVCSNMEDAEFVKYSTETTMRADFVSGKLDAVVKNCFRPWENETIVYQFGADACYFVVRAEDSALAADITDGMSELFLSYPSFPGDTYQKNIANYGSQRYAYSAEERLYLASHKEITMGYNLGADISETYDYTTERLTGIVGSIIDRIAESTGLKIKIVPYNSISECMDAMASEEADIVFGGVHEEGVSGYSGYFVSAPVTRSPIVFAGRADTELSDVTAVATAKGDAEVAKYLERFYPQWAVSRYSTSTIACEMVMSGREKLVCMDCRDALYLRSAHYEELVIHDVLPVFHSECIAVSRRSNELRGILEKAVAQINGNESVAEIYNVINSQSVVVEKHDTYVWFIVAGFAALAGLLAVCIVIATVKSRRLSEIDTLTGGRTRRRYIADSEKALRKSNPDSWAVAVFDIDKFKFINDRLGYDEGNRMLERLYKTIGDHLEPDEIFARVSDDNFACTVKNASDGELENRLNNIFAEFDRRNSLFVSYPVLFSAGVCRLGQCADRYGMVDFNAAIDRCNIAKKTIKGRHSNAVAFYDGKVRDDALREKDFENVMPTALKEHEFVCYIQPKYGTNSRHIEGGEALIRWNSREFGFVYPDRFIPIAEKNGFVVELDFFILEEICKAMRRWIDRGLTPVVISVNQSRMHLNNDDYIWRLREIVDKYGIPYEYIELELTESVFTEDSELMLRIMQKLHEIGFKLSIDDFGSGYSSLNMLKDIPADVVKIDREFFSDTVNSQKGRAVISTVVDLAKNLDMQVISEGVETVEQVDFLQDIDCNMVQGYYFAKPMPIGEFEELWAKDLAGESGGEEAYN